MGMVELLNWTVTPWKMSGKGKWEGITPVILVEGRPPFSADHPDAYIHKLLEMHDDQRLTRGRFYTLIGEFQDALEQYWDKEVSHEAGPHRNDHRKGSQRN